MVDPNSHLPSGSHRGWLLVVWEGRKKSAIDFGSLFQWCSIWMYCLKAEAGSIMHSRAPSNTSQLQVVKLDDFWPVSHLLAVPRGAKASYSKLNAARGILD